MPVNSLASSVVLAARRGLVKLVNEQAKLQRRRQAPRTAPSAPLRTAAGMFRSVSGSAIAQAQGQKHSGKPEADDVEGEAFERRPPLHLVQPCVAAGERSGSGRKGPRNRDWTDRIGEVVRARHRPVPR